MKKCKVCGDKTKVVFNIQLRATPICENCANAIFLQQAKSWAVGNLVLLPVCIYIKIKTNGNSI